MRGDALASGDRSATFFPPALDVDIADPKPHQTDFDCICGVSYGNVSDFCDHARKCDGRPKPMGSLAWSGKAENLIDEIEQKIEVNVDVFSGMATARSIAQLIVEHLFTAR